MSELLDKFEKMLENMSLKELHASRKFLDEEFKRRVSAKMPPHRIFTITILRTMVDVEIKERELLKKE